MTLIHRYSRHVSESERQRRQLQQRQQSDCYGDTIRPDIRIVARNIAPQWVCDGCRTETNVKQIDPVEFGNSYCDHCAADHCAGPEIGLLWIGNSPRVGMCGWEPDDSERESEGEKRAVKPVLNAPSLWGEK